MRKFLHFFLPLLFAAGLLSAQIPNSDMELWSSAPTLTGWETNSYPLTLPPFDPYIVRKDADRYSGSWAADLHANGIFKAYAKTTFPVQFHPANLSLYYKLNFPPCVNDSGFAEQDTVSVLVELLNNGTVVDQGYWESRLNSLSYSQLVIPMSQNSAVFDSCRITLLGGTAHSGCGIVAAQTEFRVDHFELKYSNQTDCIDSAQICDTCICNRPYLPVCGCNGVTYTNVCAARNAGVTSWNTGTCGSLGGCIDSNLICGTCACPMIYNPVCGCNGITYSNSCEATNAGVTSWNAGACNVTGCIDSLQICDTCICPQFVDPVCGCNGLTYINYCYAQSAGVISWTPGSCSVNTPCPVGYYYWLDSAGYTANFVYSTGFVTYPSDSSQTFNWDFGDGSSSSDQSPSHTYSDTSIHTYLVCLTVNDTVAICTNIWCDSVHVGAFVPGCNAGFGYIIDSTGIVTVMPDSSITVSNGGNWSIGADTSTVPTPTFPLDSSGNFTVCYAVSNDSIHCTDTVCLTGQQLYAAFLAMGYQPLSFGKFQANLYPNPASAKTELKFVTSQNGTVDIALKNLLGEVVYQFPRAKLNAGTHSNTINLESLSNGIYLVELKINGSVAAVRKLVKE